MLSLPQSTSLKKANFALLHCGREDNVKPRMRAGTQKQGTVRWNHGMGKITVKISAALFKGRMLVAGSVPEDIPREEPPQSNDNKKRRWAYSLETREFLSSGELRTTKRELEDKYLPHRIPEWAMHPV